MNRSIRAVLLAAVVSLAAPALAAPVVTTVRADLAQSPFTFSFQGGSFTFGATGDFFAPLSVRTGGVGEVNSFFGQPTTFFVDRGTVTFGPDSFPAGFTAFPTTTTVPLSNGRNFLGLRATVGDRFFYGFAFTDNAVLNSFGFETVAGRAITATTALAAVPEPATWGLMIVGVGAVGGAMRRRASVRFAA